MSNCEEEAQDSKFKINCEIRSSNGVFGSIQNVCDSWIQNIKNGELKKKVLNNVCCLLKKPKLRKKHVCGGQKHHYEAIKKIYEENICNLKEADHVMKAARNIEKSCIAAKDIEKKKKYKKLATELKETANRKQYNSFRDASVKLKVLEAEIGICNNNKSKCVLVDANLADEFISTNYRGTCHQKDNFTQYEFDQKNNYKKNHHKRSYTIDETKMWEIIIHQHLSTCSTCREKNDSKPFEYNECDKSATEAKQVTSKPYYSNNIPTNIQYPAEAPQVQRKHLGDCEYFYVQNDLTNSHQKRGNLDPRSAETQEKRNILQEEDGSLCLPNYQGAARSTPSSQVLPRKSQRSHFSSLSGGFHTTNNEYRPVSNSVYQAALCPQSRFIPQPEPINQTTYNGIKNYDNEPAYEHLQVPPYKYQRPPLSNLLAGLNKKKKECSSSNKPVYEPMASGPESRFKPHSEPIKDPSCLKSCCNRTEPFNEYFQGSPHNGQRFHLCSLPGTYRRNSECRSVDKPSFEKTVIRIPQCEPIKQTNYIENSLKGTAQDFDDENIYQDYPPCEKPSYDENFYLNSVPHLGSEKEYLVRSLSRFWEYGQTDTDINVSPLAVYCNNPFEYKTSQKPNEGRVYGMCKE